MLTYAPMRATRLIIVILLFALFTSAVDSATMSARRKRAANAFHDGILMVHALSRLDLGADGYRQDPYFYYFTGLENTVGAIFAVDGKTAESWLFLPDHPPYQKRGLQPEALPGPEAARRLGIDHVVDWSEFDGFLSRQAASSPRIFYADDNSAYPELPVNLLSAKAAQAPLWIQAILQKYPAFEVKEASDDLNALMFVQDAAEMAALRAAAKSTVTALLAGLRTIHPGVSQRIVESSVENSCWNTGAHGTDFWPWAFSGENTVFPRPFFSAAVYDHLNTQMRAGDLVRLDVGCEWQHYQGDLGRTVPVSGHYTDDQRETWNVFVAAYHAGVAALRAGVTVDQVFEVWRSELLKHRAAAKSTLAQHAIDSWSKRENVPFWQIHATNLVAARPPATLPAGMTINFEPIASVDGQGFFLEDMFLITQDGAELLTPRVPYSAEEIEALMR
ncbi:MAG: aminopeptidase P N-terminal domain-containing protein [Candidatus Sulfotelmatobacter sp.]